MSKLSKITAGVDSYETNGTQVQVLVGEGEAKLRRLSNDVRTMTVNGVDRGYRTFVAKAILPSGNKRVIAGIVLQSYLDKVENEPEKGHVIHVKAPLEDLINGINHHWKMSLKGVGADVLSDADIKAFAAMEKELIASLS